MQTFTKSGFQLEPSMMPLIAKIIRDVQAVKVEDMADTLTDRAPAVFTDEELQWMKRTFVQNITMGKTYTADGSEFFDLLVDDDMMLRISARSTGNGEFRGDIVQKVINAARLTNTVTVYDAFQEHISSVASNAQFIYATNGIINFFLQDLGFDPKSSIASQLKRELRDRLNAFGQSVFSSLDDINLFDSGGKLTNEGQQYLDGKLLETFEAKPFTQEFVDFINAFRRFETQLNVIDKNSKSFAVGSAAYTAATELSNTLSTARNDLIEGNISVKQFKNSCESACRTAENSPLNQHNVWKQIFAGIVLVVGSIATLGIANIISKLTTGSFNFTKTNTDSMNKLQSMKEKLRDIHPDVDNQCGEVDEQSHHTPTL